MKSIHYLMPACFSVLLLLQGCQTDPYQDKVSELAKPYLEHEYLVGVSVGILTPDGQYSYHFGETRRGGAAPDDQTLYEIGSITKTMTGLLLADGVTRGLYDIDAPVQGLLANDTEIDKRITLRRLSTHTSGLQRIPSNMFPYDPRDPYASYTEERLLTYLRKPNMLSEPGEEAAYSNIGVGLLGYALAKQAGISFEDLIEQRVFKPLAMHDTTIALSDRHRTHMAQPHNGDGDPDHLWHLPTLAGAGGVRSNVRDMLTYAAAQLHPDSTPLTKAIRLSQSEQNRPDEAAFNDPMGLGWFIVDHGTALAHDGGTGGFATMLKVSLKDQTAVVLLANTSSKYAGVLAKQVSQLVADQVIDPVDLPKTVSVPEEVLEGYAGRYTLLDLGFVEIEYDAGKLYSKQANQNRTRLFAEGDDSFRYRTVQGTVQFKRDEMGKVTHLVMTQNGQAFICPYVPETETKQKSE